MSTDNKLKEIKLRLQLIMLLRKLNKIYAHDKAISSDEPKWITVHPHGKGAINKNGEDIKGTPVLLESETGEVLGGMGGKYNGVHISEACSKENTLNTQHDIKRGQMMRENPQKFAAEQKAREQKAQQHLKDLQDTAKKETAKEQQKAKAKQTQAQKKQQESKVIQPNDPSKAVDYSLLDTDVKDIASGHDLKSWQVRARTNIVKTAEYGKDIELAYKAADGSGWKSAKGVVFDDKKLNEKFMHLEKEVYKYKALQRVCDVESHKPLDAQTIENGEKLTQQYNEVCKQWAQSQLADVSQKLDTARAEYQKAYSNLDSISWGFSKSFTGGGLLTAAGKSGHITAAYAEQFARTCKAGKTLDDPDVKKLNCSDALKSYLLADAMYTKIQDDLNYLNTTIRYGQKENQSTLDQLKLYKPKIKAAAEKAKSVLLATHGVNNVSTAITREASKLTIAQRNYIDMPDNLVGIKRDKPMSFDQANNGAANPHFDTVIEAKAGRKVFNPYHVNCQTCVLTHEMRLRGYDVEAQPNYEDGANGCLDLSYDCVGLWRNKTTGASPDVISLPTFASLKDAVPLGARFAMNWGWKNSPSGHIVTVGHDEKGVYVYDPQTGYKYSPDEYNNRNGHNVKNLCMWRIDDCDFDDKVANSVLTKPHQPPIRK